MIVVLLVVEVMSSPELQRRKKMIRRRKYVTEKMSDQSLLRNKGAGLAVLCRIRSLTFK